LAGGLNEWLPAVFAEWHAWRHYRRVMRRIALAKKPVSKNKDIKD